MSVPNLLIDLACRLTQNDPLGFAIFGLQSPVTEDACLPRFFQLRRSVDEYIMGVSSISV